MATSRKQRNTTIDATHHDWYKQIAANNPYTTIAGMTRQAHEVYQRNYTLLNRLQRQLQDNDVFMTSAQLISRLLRLAIYKKVDLVTTVNEKSTVVTRVKP